MQVIINKKTKCLLLICPEEMKLENEKFPKGYFQQLIFPFCRDPKSFEPTNPSTR